MMENRAGEGIRRRKVLAGAALSTVAGVAGCPGDDSADSGGCPSGEIVVESPDGTTHCVEPVESPQSVAEYYSYGGGQSDSASTQDELAANDATVVFVYRNTDSGDRSLVVINGDARTTADGGGSVAMTVEGVSGSEWLVQDGPPGTGGGDQDPYQTGSGTLGESETVLWGWDDTKTDGGALGPLGESFEITVLHQAEGSVGDQTRTRSGLDRLLFVDGADLDSYIELATIEDGTGDLSVRVASGGE